MKLASGLGPAERAALRAAAGRAAEAAARSGRPCVAALRLPFAGAHPLECFAAAAGGERFYWEVPARGLSLAATGVARALEASGPGRFAAAAAFADALWEEAVLEGSAARAEAGPLLFAGFGFADAPAADPRWRGFPPLRLVLPERLESCCGGRGWQTHICVVEPRETPRDAAERAEARADVLAAPRGRRGDAPDAGASFRAAADAPHERYRRAVSAALRAIAAGEIEKVVLARSCTLSRPGGFDGARVLGGLRTAHPTCFVHAVGRGDALLLGASPERLLRRSGTWLRADALAGSAARGRSPEEDLRLARALRESKKEQAEHAAVKQALLEALGPLCEPLRAPEAPRLLRLEGIQHLHTPVSGRLRPDAPRSLLALAGRLHPTPAVAGAPREAALAFLRAHEATARGWYAGGFGWLAPSGDGELAVLLRGALLRGDEATLHAGAGVVAGSTPEGELAETRLKLRAALAALLEI